MPEIEILFYETVDVQLEDAPNYYPGYLPSSYEHRGGDIQDDGKGYLFYSDNSKVVFAQDNRRILEVVTIEREELPIDEIHEALNYFEMEN